MPEFILESLVLECSEGAQSLPAPVDDCDLFLTSMMSSRDCYPDLEARSLLLRSLSLKLPDRDQADR